jgi:hypothetical protein
MQKAGLLVLLNDYGISATKTTAPTTQSARGLFADRPLAPQSAAVCPSHPSIALDHPPTVSRSSPNFPPAAAQSSPGRPPNIIFKNKKINVYLTGIPLSPTKN